MQNIMDDRPKNMPLNPEYMICYTPGKVGSTTVMRAFGSIGIGVHRCNDGNIHQYARKDYPVITMVRDPIEWAISYLFEKHLMAGLKLAPADAPDVARQIMDSAKFGLLKDYDGWIFTKLRQVTGVYVDGDKWIKKHSWKIFSMRLLVMRTDKLSEALEPAMRAFVPQYYPDISFASLNIEHRAKGVERFDFYQEFLNAIRFNVYEIADYYDKSRFANKFFYRRELKEMVRRWSTGQLPS